MADIATIRAGLASRLEVVTDQDGNTVQTSAWMQPNPTVPSLEVTGLDSISYDEAFQRGADTLIFTVQGFASEADNRAGQMTLAKWLDTSSTVSVKYALENSTTPISGVDALRVIEYTGDKVFPHVSLSRVVGGEWRVEVDVSN